MTQEPEPRARLDRDRVLTAAIELADADGLEKLSMRALATRLGVVPMALYKHVSDKDDLVASMVERIIEQYPAVSHDLHWKERVRNRVLVARELVRTHPWLAPAIDSCKRRTEAVMTHMNAVAGDFIDGGLSPDLAHYAMHALGNRIWGYASEAFQDADAPTLEDADSAEVREYLTERFQHIVAIALDAGARTPSGTCDAEAEFMFTLDLILDAVERLHETGWESRPRSVSDETKPSPAEVWEERYATSDRVWSGRVNQVLAEVASALPVGSALDLGCGEGGDAVWLAKQGWRVTGVDVSETAVARGLAAGLREGVAPEQLTLIAADLASWHTDETFDLVTASFLHSWSDESGRNAILRRASELVAPGGHMLITSHAEAPPWVKSSHHAHGDRTYPSPESELAMLDLDADWQVVIAELRERTGTGPDGTSGTLVDTVVLVQRASN